MERRREPDRRAVRRQQAHRSFPGLLSDPKAEQEYELRHEGCEMEMPRFGGHTRGREKRRGFQAAHPLRRLCSSDRATPASVVRTFEHWFVGG